MLLVQLVFVSVLVHELALKVELPLVSEKVWVSWTVLVLDLIIGLILNPVLVLKLVMVRGGRVSASVCVGIQASANSKAIVSIQAGAGGEAAVGMGAGGGSAVGIRAEAVVGTVFGLELMLVEKF